MQIKVWSLSVFIAGQSLLNSNTAEAITETQAVGCIARPGQVCEFEEGDGRFNPPKGPPSRDKGHGNPQPPPPGHHRPDRGRPDYGRPDHGRPDHGRPDYGRPDHGRPDYGRPDHGRPDHGRPDHGRPDYGRPDYGRPDYGRPPGHGYPHRPPPPPHRPPHPPLLPPPPQAVEVRYPFQQAIYGEQIFDLNRLLDLRPYYGYRILDITVNASPSRSYSGYLQVSSRGKFTAWYEVWDQRNLYYTIQPPGITTVDYKSPIHLYIRDSIVYEIIVRFIR